MDDKTSRRLKEQQSGIQSGRVGHPRAIGLDIRKLIFRMARENPGWGYFRIVGELMKLRMKISRPVFGASCVKVASIHNLTQGDPATALMPSPGTSS